MTDFSIATDEEILQFISDNRFLFARELSEDFPKRHWIALAQEQLYVIKKPYGFALCSKGRSEMGPFEAVSPTIEFLFIEQSFSGKGFGKQLVREAQAKIQRPMTLEVTCEGEIRKSFFASCGFRVVAHDEVDNRYLMNWLPE